MVRAAIVGGAGYTGSELLRLLLRHPEVSIATVTSRERAGQPLVETFPQFAGQLDLAFSMPDVAQLSEHDVVFFATPHGVAMSQAPALLARGVTVIDLGADFRLKDIATWEQWYGMTHTAPEWAAQAVYGLPEVSAQALTQAQLIACPGCYPTAVQLGLLPLLAAQAIETSDIIVDAKSGVSGAGRSANAAMLMGEVGESFMAYKASGHRHLPEIAQGLSAVAGQPVELTFVPHLLPMIRGILATCYVRLTRELDVREVYEAAYADQPFVSLLPEGAHPQTRHVRGSNYCQVALHKQGQRWVVLSSIDNLVKGAAGQAVQCMNLRFGLAQELGLQQLPLAP